MRISLAEETTEINKTALIVDDDTTNLMVLGQFLKKLDFTIIEAENGKEAIDKFVAHSPDLIFMDVMMPIMNGYEATAQIKYLCKTNFVPVIFLTALNDPEDLSKCIEAGGDDFLSKPLDMAILRSKIHAMERIRDLYRNVQDLNKTLQAADEMANKVFEMAVFNKNANVDSIDSWFESNKKFNNDLLLISHTPSNGINLLCGNFSVQGLASAVGALPASEIFYSMSTKGFSPSLIVEAINAKLYDLLPHGMTLSMVFINFDENIRQANICNFNMANVYFISEEAEKITHKQQPREDAIGQTPRHSKNVSLDRVDINQNTRIIISNKNLFSCVDSTGELYSTELFESALNKGIVNNGILNTIKQDILQFTDNKATKESISIIEIPCNRSLFSKDNNIEKEIKEKEPNRPVTNIDSNTKNVEFSMHIDGSCIKSIDPVPTLLSNLESVVQIEKHHEKLFTILTELYTNALDHGVLKLSSHIKQTDNGFEDYYLEKNKALTSLRDGFIKITLSLEFNENYNKLKITVEDSGDGFDSTPSNNQHSGRGILLIKGLCESFGYNESGNKVDVVYQWD